MKHVSIRVYGKVHGVFFRTSTAQRAQELGIKGFVRNEPDGTVCIEAEGSEENLEKLIRWCHEGPNHAEVEKVSHKYQKDLAYFKAFEVRH